MLEILLYSLASFGAAMVIVFAAIGLRVVVGAFTFAAKVGLANSRAAMLENIRADAKERLQEEMGREADEQEKKEAEKTQ